MPKGFALKLRKGRRNTRLLGCLFAKYFLAVPGRISILLQLLSIRNENVPQYFLSILEK